MKFSKYLDADTKFNALTITLGLGGLGTFLGTASGNLGDFITSFGAALGAFVGA